MRIQPDSLVADVATGDPATIKIFQEHQIDFCCGGRIPIFEACADHGLDTDTVIAELRGAQAVETDRIDWRLAPMRDLIAHIQARYHIPLRRELPRLGAMLDTVVRRHGYRLPETLLPLQSTFESLRHELLEHMAREDAVVFPAVLALEAGVTAIDGQPLGWIAQPLEVLEHEHQAAGEALATMRALTNGYAPPDDACPTFRGLYHGLATLEHDMHVHVHLENHVLFPRVSELARQGASD